MPSGLTFASILTAAADFALTDMSGGIFITAAAVVGLAALAIRKFKAALGR